MTFYTIIEHKYTPMPFSKKRQLCEMLFRFNFENEICELKRFQMSMPFIYVLENLALITYR